jgi:FPC/CPF motif-containing protein YcgG
VIKVHQLLNDNTGFCFAGHGFLFFCPNKYSSIKKEGMAGINV